jgi:hypothetical protein
MSNDPHSRLFYATGEEVRLGDRVSLRYWFRRRVGTVSYIPGISPPDPELEYEGVRQWAITLDAGTELAIGYFPEHPRAGQPKPSLRLLDLRAASSLPHGADTTLTMLRAAYQDKIPYRDVPVVLAVLTDSMTIRGAGQSLAEYAGKYGPSDYIAFMGGPNLSSLDRRGMARVLEQLKAGGGYEAWMADEVPDGVPAQLQLTYGMLRGAFPHGIPGEYERAVCAVLHSHASIRAAAGFLAVYHHKFGPDDYIEYMADVSNSFAFGLPPVTDADKERVVAMLRPHGFDAWVRSTDDE